MLFTVTQIESNEGVFERCHYINWPGDTDTDVLDKFSFPVLFLVHIKIFSMKLTFMPSVMMQFGKPDSFPWQGWHLFHFVRFNKVNWNKV